MVYDARPTFGDHRGAADSACAARSCRRFAAFVFNYGVLYDTPRSVA